VTRVLLAGWREWRVSDVFRTKFEHLPTRLFSYVFTSSDRCRAEHSVGLGRIGTRISYADTAARRRVFLVCGFSALLFVLFCCSVRRWKIVIRWQASGAGSYSSIIAGVWWRVLWKVPHTYSTRVRVWVCARETNTNVYGTTSV